MYRAVSTALVNLPPSTRPEVPSWVQVLVRSKYDFEDERTTKKPVRKSKVQETKFRVAQPSHAAAPAQQGRVRV